MELVALSLASYKVQKNLENSDPPKHQTFASFALSNALLALIIRITVFNALGDHVNDCIGHKYRIPKKPKNIFFVQKHFFAFKLLSVLASSISLLPLYICMIHQMRGPSYKSPIVNPPFICANKSCQKGRFKNLFFFLS